MGERKFDDIGTFGDMGNKDLRKEIWEIQFWKYEVIHNALKVMCNKNSKRPHNFGHICSFGDLDNEIILTKND